MAEILDSHPEATGLAVRPKVLVYGFSRGAQTANRFALAFPERVAGDVATSAGTYTVPAASFSNDGATAPLPFPYGVADLAQVAGVPFDPSGFASVPFWIGVGERDVDPADVPPQWDPYIGDDRVERAHRFAAWVRRAGGSAQVQVVPGMGHGESIQERSEALSFLAGLP